MAGKIKITDVSGTNIEGASDELTKFFKENNCNLSDYLTPQTGNVPEKGQLWPVIVSGILLIANTIIIRLVDLNQTWYTVFSIALFVFYTILLLSTYLRWKLPSTIIIGFMGAIMLLIALGVMSPEEAAKDIKEKIEKTEQTK